MHMATTEIFLIAMTIIFSVPYLIWRLGGTDYYAPLVVVQIIAGILLGPGIMGRAFLSTIPSCSTRKWCSR
jgi:predicted membrane protein